MPSELAGRVFRIVDSTDVQAFVALTTEDAVLVFANAGPLVGQAAIATGLGAFYQTIQGLSHEFVNEWVVGDSTVVESKVTYTRLDGKLVTIPATTIWHITDAGLIDSYRIYVDTTPVYA